MVTTMVRENNDSDDNDGGDKADETYNDNDDNDDNEEEKELCTHKKMKIIFLDIIIFGSKVIFFKFLFYYIDYIVGSTLSFFYQNGPWGGRYHCSKDEH